jgi:hypothetical protein
VDVAADVLPVPGGAIVAGWTTAGDSAADAFLVRVDSTGTVTWRRHLGGAGADLLFSVQDDGRGGYVAAGLTTSHGEGGDGWLVALDGEGRVRWERNFGGPGHDRLTALARAPRDGGWVAAGQGARGADTQAWVLHTDRDGNEVAAWTWGDPGATERGFDLEVLPDGGVVLVGSTTAAAGTNASADELDGFVARLERDGSARWTHRIDGPGRQIAYHVRVGPGERFLVTGYGQTGSDGEAKAIVRLVGPAGRAQWTAALGESSSTVRGVQSVLFDDLSSVVVGYRKPARAPADAAVWTTMVYGLDPSGRTRWSLPLGGPGRESGRWIAGPRDDLWVVSQVAAGDGGSRILVVRLDASAVGAETAAPGRTSP